MAASAENASPARSAKLFANAVQITASKSLAASHASIAITALECRSIAFVNAGVKLGRGAAQNWATLGLRETSARERRPVSRALHVAGG